MSDIIHQESISDHDSPQWKGIFSQREYEYLAHVISGLIKFGEFKSVAIQYGKDKSRRTLHIFEPFNTLNYLGFMSPSVVSITFNDNNEIEYLTGNDNGLGIFSREVTLDCVRTFPRNSVLEIDFWHFVDAIGAFSGY